MTKTFTGTKDTLDKTALDIVRTLIKKILSKQEKLVIGVPGGRSVTGLYRLLSQAEGIPWEKIHIFMVAEKFVPLHDKDSNFRVVREFLIDELFNRGVLPEQNAHPFVMIREDAGLSVAEYEKDLKIFGGAYDIILLGIGEDGHVASLFPHHHSIMNTTPFYVPMNDSPKPPPNRMTMSRTLLLKSGAAIVFITGESKKAAYRNFLNPDGAIEDCPAKLALLIEDSYILTDMTLANSEFHPW